MKRMRREIERSTKTYTLTVREIQNIKDEAVNEAVDLSCRLLFALSGMVLRDKWGFGKKRMKRFIEQLLDAYESYSIGYVNIEDCMGAIKEETGYNIAAKISEIDKRAAIIIKKNRKLNRLLR